MLWAAAGLVATFAWRADFYVYLQSQSVALVVLAAFLWCTSQREWWRRSQMTAIAFIIALWLGAAHTVSGGAAVAVLAGTHDVDGLGDVLHRRRQRCHRRVAEVAAQRGAVVQRDARAKSCGINRQ